MNLKEAYSTLGLPSGSSPEDVKKKYKELATKYHPDVDKSEGANGRFQKINEAYQVITSGNKDEPIDWNPFVRRGPGGFHFRKEIQADIIALYTSISFKESVFGCKQDIKYKRNIKCSDCGGIGSKFIHNGCETCGGRGQITQQMRGMIIVQDCPKCQGKVATQDCKTCDSNGTIESEASVSVTVPGGIMDNNILRLSGMGNFVGNFGPIDQYTDVHLHIHVISEPGLSLIGPNVVSSLQISLLEAIVGCTKNVKTVLGNREININPLSKNKDEIYIPGLGVNQKGSHVTILDIKYPEDTNKLIDALKEES